MLFFDGGFFYVCLDQKALRHDHTFTRLETFQYFNTLCIAAAEFHRTVAPGYTLLHDVPFTRTIARYHPLLAPLTRLPLVGRLSERIVVLRAPA